MGLDVYVVRGQHPKREDEDEDRERYVEIPSAKYPEHYFKIGYWRSSYNESGINSVLRQYGLPDLYAIAQAQDAYAWTPDWPDIIARADMALDAFDGAADRMRYHVTDCMRIRADVRSSADALERFLTETKRALRDDMRSYSNGDGLFLLNGEKMYALLHGVNSIGTPTVYAVLENTGSQWYRQALEIVRETAEWVLAQPDPNDFHIHWSS